MAAQKHAGFFRSAVAFFDVAFEAGGSDIIPGITTTSGARDDVIYGQVMTPYTTVLTGVAVPVKDVSS